MTLLCVCQKPASKHCGACKRVFYCSSDCQKADWKVHKTSCASRIKICIFDGDEVVEAYYNTDDDFVTDVSGWYPCQVPALLGIPLLVKRFEPSRTKKNNEIGVFMTVEVETGLAPVEWSSESGKLAFMRADKQNLGSEVLWDLYDYIHGVLMAEYADGKLEHIKKKKLNKEAFEDFRFTLS
jgi:hypothetical protein